MEHLELDRAIRELELRRLRSPFDGLVMDKVLEHRRVRRWDGRDPAYRPARPAAGRGIPPRRTLRRRGARYGGGESIPTEAVGGFYTAEVSVKDQVLDPDSSTFRVRLNLANPDYELPAGVKCHLRFLTQ